LGSGVNDLLTNGVWGRGDDGPCRVFSDWVALLQRGEGRVWLAVLFENGPLRTVGAIAVQMSGFGRTAVRASRSTLAMHAMQFSPGRINQVRLLPHDVQFIVVVEGHQHHDFTG
jgi:hypothetical protein